MSDYDNDKLAPGQVVLAFEPDLSEFKWAKTPTHIPPKRPVKVYSIELSDPMLRIATTPPPFKNILN